MAKIINNVQKTGRLTPEGETIYSIRMERRLMRMDGPIFVGALPEGAVPTQWNGTVAFDSGDTCSASALEHLETEHGTIGNIVVYKNAGFFVDHYDLSEKPLLTLIVEFFMPHNASFGEFSSVSIVEETK